MRLTRDLMHKYQERAVEHIMDVPCCALHLDMGLGKSVSTLTAVADLYQSVEFGRVLIIAPLRVANSTWPTEIESWEHTAHLDYSVLTGAKVKREASAADPSTIHIINRENVPWLVSHWGTKWPYDLVVIDEASSFKNHKSQRFKALKSVKGRINRIVELTGSPAANGLIDLYAQIWLLDRGERLGKNITAFRNRYATPVYKGFGYDWEMKPWAIEAIPERISDIVLTMRAEDYLDLPGRTDNIIELELPEKLMKQYKEFQKELVLEFESSVEDIAVFDAAALTNKLLQFANGAVYIDSDHNFEEIHQLKIDALKEIVEGSEGQPILVAYNFKSDLVRLQKAFPTGRVLDKDPQTIVEWNDSKIQLLFAHPASAGHGLNLQKGGHIMCHFGLNWSLELYEQFVARLDRQGQKHHVVNHHLVVKGTMDEMVLSALRRKTKTQDALKDALKTIMI